MNISTLKTHLSGLSAINFHLPDGSAILPHFHVTEVGLVTKQFIDCGGMERSEKVACFQLWEAGDYDHKLAPQKFLRILELSRKILGDADHEIEVEYQQETIGRFGLDFNGTDFLLIPRHTACLASDACGNPEQPKKAQLQAATSVCCAPGGGCC